VRIFVYCFIMRAVIAIRINGYVNLNCMRIIMDIRNMNFIFLAN